MAKKLEKTESGKRKVQEIEDKIDEQRARKAGRMDNIKLI